MNTAPLAALLALFLTGLHQRVDRLRRRPDHGGHAVEYAIGIAGSALVILGVIAALKTGLGDVVKSWIFKPAAP